jgi:hypothetical protein
MPGTINIAALQKRASTLISQPTWNWSTGLNNQKQTPEPNKSNPFSFLLHQDKNSTKKESSQEPSNQTAAKTKEKSKKTVHFVEPCPEVEMKSATPTNSQNAASVLNSAPGATFPIPHNPFAQMNAQLGSFLTHNGATAPIFDPFAAERMEIQAKLEEAYMFIRARQFELAQLGDPLDVVNWQTEEMDWKPEPSTSAIQIK